MLDAYVVRMCKYMIPTCHVHSVKMAELAGVDVVSQTELESSLPTPSLSSCPDSSKPSTRIKSLLEVLRAPQKSELVCKHSVVHNLPHDGRRSKP